MPAPINIEQAATYTGAGAVFATLLGLVVRFLMRTFRTDRLEAASASAEISTYNKLKAEIARLESIIVTMQKRTDDLETKIDQLKDMEGETQADIAVITILLAQFPCDKHCDRPIEAFAQMKEVVDRLNKRRADKSTALRETSKVPHDGSTSE